MYRVLIVLLLSFATKAQSTYITAKDKGEGKELYEYVGQFLTENEKPYSGPVFKNWSNQDIPCERGTAKNGYRHGVWVMYYMNGKLKSEGEFDNGNPLGEWKTLYSSGNTESVIKYDKAGKAQGEYLVYHKNKKIKESGVFVDGLLQGKVETFFDDGTIHKTDFYKDSKKHGQFLEYNREGIVISEWNYEDHIESGPFLETFKSGAKRRTGNMSSGKRHGEVRKFYEDGSLKSIGDYKNGMPDGLHLSYRESGDTSDVVLFKNEEKVYEIDFHSAGQRTKYFKYDKEVKNTVGKRIIIPKLVLFPKD